MNMKIPHKYLSMYIFGLRIKFKNPLYRLRLKQYQKEQKILQNRYDMSGFQQSQNMVLFVLPGIEVVSGGILSIFSLCHLTREILTNTSVLVVTEEGNNTYAQVSWFHTDEKIYRWEQLLPYLQHTDNVVIHVPEYMAGVFYKRLSVNSRKILRSIPDLRINILNQNPQLMPLESNMRNLFTLSEKVTQTLAFENKKIQELSNRYHMPITTVYSYLDLSRWKAVPLYKKEKLILLSPDENYYRKQVIHSLEKDMSDFTLIEVRNMKFEQYMELVCKAVAVVSFGEGYDGYLLQPASVKTLSFAVYNDTFFPNKEFIKLTNIYVSYQEMILNLAHDIRYKFENSVEYYEAIANLKKLDVVHSKQQVEKRLKQFYEQNYECIPEEED